MAAHRLTIAKATFSASLLRPDASCAPVSRDDMASFHKSLEATLARCTPDNVQRTKTWCLRHVTRSATRVGALGKYLVAASNAQAPSEQVKGEASWQRRRLHVLHILNDILHHAKHHEAEHSHHISLSIALQPHLADIVASVASGQSPKLLSKLQDLLDLWAAEEHYSAEYIGRLRTAAESAASSSSNGPHNDLTTDAISAATVPIQASRNAPFVMPASHGDTSTPFYDLPAANMMPHIVPNSTIPINAQLMKPLQFVAGPAEPALATAVGAFLKDVDSIYDPSVPFAEDEGIVADIDDMGQQVRKDEQTGEVLDGKTYYGWSRSFCERMKKREKEGPPQDEEHNGRRRSFSSGRSRSRSNSPRKKRRHSGSSSRSRSRGYSRSRSRSRVGRGWQRNSSRGMSRSPRPRSRQSSPRHDSTRPGYGQTVTSDIRQPSQPYPSPPAPAPGPSSSPFNPAFQAPFGLGPDGMPLPPPRPAGWQGPWPPMPPPPPPQTMLNMPAVPLPQNAGFVPPMPTPPMGVGTGMRMDMDYGTPGGHSHGQPPPPPPQSSPPGPWSWQNQGHGQGRGGWGGNGYNGRGRGRDR